jgi:hypothetical protein
MFGIKEVAKIKIHVSYTPTPTTIHARTHTHTYRGICNTYCFSKATMVKQTCLNVSSYVYFLSWFGQCFCPWDRTYGTLTGVLSRYGNIPYTFYTLLLLIIGSEYLLIIIYIWQVYLCVTSRLRIAFGCCFDVLPHLKIHHNTVEPLITDTLINEHLQ